MASSYSPKLRLELINTGEQTGTWGLTNNKNLGTLLEQAIAGTAVITMTDANYTLSTTNGASDEARCAVIIAQGVALAQRDVIIPGVSKLYVITNSTSGSQNIRIKTSLGAPVTVANGVTAQVYCDGLDTVLISSNQTSSSGTVTSITAGTGLTGGTITGSGTIALATIAGLTPGTYGNSSTIPVLQVDQFGRIVAASSASITGGAGSGTVTRVNTGSGLTGGPITTTGTISLAATGVGAGSYGSATQVPVITVDTFGRITNISLASSSSSSTSISNTGGSVTTTTTGILALAGTGGFVIGAGGPGVAITGDVDIDGDLSSNGAVQFTSNSSATFNADIINTNGATRWGNTNQTLHIGGASSSDNRVNLSTSGSNVRGISWDGSNFIVGRGIPNGSNNILYFTGDSSFGTATFSVSGVFKPGGGSFSASSDIRLKTVSGPYSLGLEAVKQLRPIIFSYKSAPAGEFVGLIAQDVQDTELNAMVSLGDDGYLKLDNSQLIYAVVNALKEIDNRLFKLEGKGRETNKLAA